MLGWKAGWERLGVHSSLCLSPCFWLCLQWLPLILPCGFCPRFLLSLYPLLLCFRSGLTPVKARNSWAEQRHWQRRYEKFPRCVCSPWPLHVILDSPPHPQWSRRCCFIILTAMILVDLILTPYLRISPTAKKQHGARVWGPLKMGFSSWMRLSWMEGWHNL